MQLLDIEHAVGKVTVKGRVTTQNVTVIRHVTSKMIVVPIYWTFVRWSEKQVLRAPAMQLATQLAVSMILDQTAWEYQITASAMLNVGTMETAVMMLI